MLAEAVDIAAELPLMRLMSPISPDEPVRAVLFDLDGTLYDRDRLAADLFHAQYAAFAQGTTPSPTSKARTVPGCWRCGNTCRTGLPS